MCYTGYRKQLYLSHRIQDSEFICHAGYRAVIGLVTCIIPFSVVRDVNPLECERSG